MKLFSTRASLYHRIFFDFFRYDQGLKDFFLKTDYLSSQLKILDAGCGSGAVTKSLIDIAHLKKYNSIRCYGFDITPEMLDIFRSWNDTTKSEVNIVQADIVHLETLPDTWHDFNLIIVSAVLEYISKNQVVYALKNLKSLLSSHGTVVLFISKKNLINKWLIRKWWQACLYERDEIYQKLESAGFITIQFDQFYPPYSYLNAWGYVISAKNLN